MEKRKGTRSSDLALMVAAVRCQLSRDKAFQQHVAFRMSRVLADKVGVQGSLGYRTQHRAPK